MLITIVLLVSWLEDAEPLPEYEVLDLFAGAARVARASRHLGMEAGSFDIGYHENREVFDINSRAGFTFPESILYL